MAELATVARPYAEALFKVAQSGNLSDWAALINELAQVAVVPEVQSVVDNPKLGSSQIADLVLGLLKTAVTPETKNLLTALLQNGKFKALPEIAEQFEALRNAAEGSADAEIVSAFPLEAAQLAELTSALERKFGRKLKSSVTVDPGLIGGVKVTVGDEVLDTSVKARLAQMRVALTS